MNNRKELCPQGEKLLECRTYEEAIVLYRQILTTISDEDVHAALNWYLREANNRIDAVDVRVMRIGCNWTGEPFDIRIETEPRVGNHSKRCRDHFGNEYESIKAMCEHYGISCKMFEGRRSFGWSLKDALTKPRHHSGGRKASPCYDHLGNEYASISDMCEHWAIKESTYAYRRQIGYTLERALTQKTGCFDHLGRQYQNQEEMCRYWGISIATFRRRRESDWPLEKILTEPLNHCGRGRHG